ncbi:MAG: SPOR domain-containing protein [Pseudomonadota bacterium]
MTHSPKSRPRTSNKQRGGTLLGIIIGALLGLGAALAVAVYVTKVPVPFMNKGQSHSAENDAAEARKNKDWDPNASLAGKNAIRPGAVASGPVGNEAPVAAASAPKGSKPAASAASADPLGDLAKAKSEAKPKADAKPDAVAAASAGADPFSYFIQAGAFRTPEDAEAQRAKLSLMGFQAKVTEREQSGRTVYRVRLGPFDKKDEADKTKEKLDSNAIETALVRVQR